MPLAGGGSLSLGARAKVTSPASFVAWKWLVRLAHAASLLQPQGDQEGQARGVPGPVRVRVPRRFSCAAGGRNPSDLVRCTDWYTVFTGTSLRRAISRAGGTPAA